VNVDDVEDMQFEAYFEEKLMKKYENVIVSFVKEGNDEQFAKFS
jgi:hypothetical protein